MSEEESIKEIQKPVMNKWAKVSFVCGISVWAIFVFFVFCTGLFSIPEVYTNWEIAGAIYTGLALFSIFVPVALSLVSLISV